jgi:hypothetical protein
MPDEPMNGGTYLIQNKATGLQFGLPDRSIVGSYKDQQIVPRDQGAVWEIEFVPTTDRSHCYRFKTVGPFPGPIWKIRILISAFSVAIQDPPSMLARQAMLNSRYGNRNREQMVTFALVIRATGLALDGTNRNIHTKSRNLGDFQRWGFFTAPPGRF